MCKFSLIMIMKQQTPAEGSCAKHVSKHENKKIWAVPFKSVKVTKDRTQGQICQKLAERQLMFQWYAI